MSNIRSPQPKGKNRFYAVFTFILKWHIHLFNEKKRRYNEVKKTPKM